jgi:nucleoside-diphosphate-sugar epimerase
LRQQVQVLILGGTGSIGAPVVRALVGRGHHVIALARSDSSATKVASLGANPLGGDIAAAERWLPALPPLDAVVHLACDFGSDMVDVDRRLLDGLLPHLAAQPNQARFIYTGGCWLFGATGNEVANEQSPFRPLQAFAWMVPHLQRVLETKGIAPIVIHPAMVYEPAAGVFAYFVAEARKRRPIRVVGGEHVRWPLVHRDDLADLYVLALERGTSRTSYIGAAIPGLPVGRIARAIAQRFGLRDHVPKIVSADAIAAELGDWARGRAMDQQLSGEKARRELGWMPVHLDPEGEIAALAMDDD